MVKVLFLKTLFFSEFLYFVDDQISSNYKSNYNSEEINDDIYFALQEYRKRFAQKWDLNLLLHCQFISITVLY